MSTGETDVIAPMELDEACERAYDTGIEQVTLDDDELLEGLGVELSALIDRCGIPRDTGFIVSKAIKTAPISTLVAGKYGRELVERLEVGVNFTYQSRHGSELWTPNNFSVNQYKTGDSIQPHNDCLMQGLLGRAMIMQGLIEETEEVIAADKDVYLEFIQDTNRRNPYAHDFILQVLGKKTLKHWPGDKLYGKDMSQEEQDEAVEIETNPGDLTIVRREILGTDKLPVTHSVPTVLEDGLSLVLF